MFRTHEKTLDTNQPGTSKSFASNEASNDQSQQSSNLFSALKFWMAKRVDSLSTSSTPNKNTSTKSDSASKVNKSLDAENKAEDSTAKTEILSLISRQKNKKKLKTIKSMSNFSVSTTDSADSSSISSNRSSQLAEFSSLTSSSSTFDSYNSIIETNSINKIFEEKFSNVNDVISPTENMARASSDLTSSVGQPPATSNNEQTASATTSTNANITAIATNNRHALF